MAELTLKGLVVSRYGSMAGFARTIGWSDRKARDVISGRQTPSAMDMEVVADMLDIKSAQEFVYIFFPEKSTLWT